MSGDYKNVEPCIVHHGPSVRWLVGHVPDLPTPCSPSTAIRSAAMATWELLPSPGHHTVHAHIHFSLHNYYSARHPK